MEMPNTLLELAYMIVDHDERTQVALRNHAVDVARLKEQVKHLA
jgi:hypothetical protein